MATMAPPECAICADALFGAPPTTAACGHNFHVPCLASWITSERARAHAPSCPVCRGRVEPDPASLRINHDLAALLAALAAAAPRQSVGGSGSVSVSGSGSAGGGAAAALEIAPAALAISTDVIGEGSYGQVRRGAWEGAPVAVKLCMVATEDADPSVRRSFEREARALAALRHPNVLPLYGVSHLPDGRLALVLKLAEGGALDKAIYGGRGGEGGSGAAAAPALEETCALFAGIARGLAFIHSRGLAHNDLKSMNVLLDEHSTPMLADFGLVKAMRSGMPGTFAAAMARSSGLDGAGMLGSPLWTAPENFDDENPNYGKPPADVYSLGIIGFELATRSLPWRGKNLGQIVAAVQAGRRPDAELLASLDARLRGVITDCWKQDPAARPSAVDVQMRLQAIAGRAGQRPLVAPAKKPAVTAPVAPAETPAPSPPAAWVGSSVAEYLRPLKAENILHEGFLRVRAEIGFFGLRPWLLRYFVICKHDHTLRRFHTADEVEAPVEKNLKVYLLKDIESVVPDVPPRFQLQLKSRSMDKEGVVVKLAADLEAEKLQWIRVLTKAIADCP